MNDAPQKLPRFQFSLRSLFWLTTVVAMVVGTMSMLGRTHSFRALGSYHAYVALLPIVGVWAAWRLLWLDGWRLTATAISLYLASLVLTALGEDNAKLFGWLLLYMSGLGVTLLLSGGVPSGSAWPVHIGPGPGTETWVACWMGFIANTSFLLNLLLTVPRAQRARRVRKFLSWLSLTLSILVLAPLGWSNDLDAIYIGYGVWVSAMLAMWLGVRGRLLVFPHPRVE
jgi:hypothetical protein